MNLSPEMVVSILTALGAGGILSKIVDAWIAGRRERTRANDPQDALNQAAFWAEQYAALREKCLEAGMSLSDLGPRPRFDPDNSP